MCHFANWTFPTQAIFTAEGVDDCLRLRQHVAEWEKSSDRPVISLLMGEPGRLTRVLNTFLCPVTHELISVSAAPGQMLQAQIENLRSALGVARVAQK